MRSIEAAGLRIIAAAPIVTSAPLGPSRRHYANGAVLVESTPAPDALLDILQGLERAFGRRRRGARWQARVLDLDIVLWSGGAWSTPHLTIPHPAFRSRRFVVGPAARIAPRWRDRVTGLTLRHLATRLDRPRPAP